MPACRRVAVIVSLFTLVLASNCSRSTPRDPEVVRLVDVIAHGERRIVGDEDEVLAPAALVELIRLGPAAVPTLLDLLPTTTDSWTRSMLFEALGHIGDPRAREPIERLLARPTRDIPDGALTVIEQLAQPESIPALQALLARPDRGGFRRARLLGALVRVGDDSVVEQLIDLGLETPNERYDALEALTRHTPLRSALGLTDGRFVEEDELFLRAAKEWALERRGEPSPWKASRDFAFREPFAAEKQQAFALVTNALATQADAARCLPVDVAVATAAPQQPVALLFGWGHAHNLFLDVWRPRGATAQLHRFWMQRGARRSKFAEDAGSFGHEVGETPILAMQRALAGVHAARATRLVAWWQGPGMVHWMNTANFAVLFLGANDAATSGFCGYPSSTHLLDYPTFAAARDWHLHVAEDCDLRPAVATDDDRRLFADVWRRSREHWSDEDWWFVRERIIAMAGAFGDASLVPSLLDHLQPRFAEGEHSLSLTAAHACTALAAITGTDLRFDADGEPRSVAEVARDYRERFAK